MSSLWKSDNILYFYSLHDLLSLTLTVSLYLVYYYKDSGVQFVSVA